jgi:ACR3 family arsenite efflux pump ArsB
MSVWAFVLLAVILYIALPFLYGFTTRLIQELS